MRCPRCSWDINHIVNFIGFFHFLLS